MAYEAFTGQHLGYGLSRIPNQIGDALAPKPNRAVMGEPKPGRPVSHSATYHICRTASELAQAMQRQGGGSLTGLGFLPLLGSKLEFYRSLRTTIFGLSLVVHARRGTGSTQLLQPTLAAGVEAPRTDNELEKFVRLYGDSYLSSVDVGGECIGVYTFRSETREQAKRVEHALQVGGLVSGLQLGADLKHTVEDVSRTNSINVDFHYEVWGCSEVPKLHPDNLVDYALGFGDTIDSPMVLDLATEGYESLPEIDTAFRPVAANRDLFTRRGGLLRKHQRLCELINQMDSARRTLDIYGVSLPDATQLASNRDTALTDIATIDAMVEAYKAAPSASLAEPDLPSLANGSPRIRAKVGEEGATRIGRVEERRGKPFTFPYDWATSIQNQVRLEAIGLEAGWRVDKLRLSYSSSLGSGSTQDVCHGGDRGDNLGDLPIASGEGITAIYSEFGTNIDKLRLQTNQGILESSGNQGDKQHPVDWRPVPGQVVLGFSGRSDDEPDGAVYSLQAVVARIEGIDWEPIDALDMND